MVPRVGVEPTWALSPLDFESSAYTNFATPAAELLIINSSAQGVNSLQNFHQFDDNLSN
jgi:hypothetical protein